MKKRTYGGFMGKKYETVGIIAAMQMEIDGIWAKLQNPTEETISGIRYVRGALHGKTVIAAKCGVGKVFAAVCAQTMILRYAPDCIINTGVAGGLQDGLQVLDLVIASHVVQHDMDTSGLGDPVGLLSGIDIIQIPCDGQMVSALQRSVQFLEKQHMLGVVASGDVFVCTEQERSRIRDQFHAAACEMEGGAIGQACYLNQVPFGVLRAISDSASADSGMDYPVFAAAAAETAVAAIDQMLQLL